MKDIWCYIRAKNELLFIQESDEEENTVEYSIYPVTKIGDMDLTKEERIFADLKEPRDGGWFTFDDDIYEMDKNSIISTILVFAYDDINEGDDIELTFPDNIHIT